VTGFSSEPSSPSIGVFGRTERGGQRDRTAWDFKVDTDQLFDRYISTKLPVEVNFRDIVPFGPGVDRATHLVHTYPAKLLLNIPLFLCNNSAFSPAGGLIYDPFCGSGTVLVESLLSGRSAFGADANPLARLIAKVKTTYIDKAAIEAGLKDILKSISPNHFHDFSPVVSVEKWFTPVVSLELSKLLSAIRRVSRDDILDFMEVCFSACLRYLSLADPRLAVPVRLKNDRLEDRIRSLESPVIMFERVVRLNCDRLQRLGDIPSCIGFGNDARTGHLIMQRLNAQADLIVTSPPYAGAQKYIRSSSLSLGWLGLAPQNKLRVLESQNIGREHYSKSEYEVGQYGNLFGAEEAIKRIRSIYPLRAHIAATYISEMEHAAISMVKALRVGGHLALVIGDNHICGEPFETSKYIKAIFEFLGLKVKLEMVDTIKSRGLMTKRNRAASSIDREHVIVFEKLKGEV